MLKFVIWFIFFGISFAVANIGGIEQAKAFMYITLGSFVLIMAFITLLFIFVGRFSQQHIYYDADFFGESTLFWIPWVLDIFVIIFIVVIFLLTWVASYLFNVDFYLAYEIITFIPCCINILNIISLKSDN